VAGTKIERRLEIDPLHVDAAQRFADAKMQYAERER
jgi:hypothetical protein